MRSLGWALIQCSDVFIKGEILDSDMCEGETVENLGTRWPSTSQGEKPEADLALLGPSSLKLHRAFQPLKP